MKRNPFISFYILQQLPFTAWTFQNKPLNIQQMLNRYECFIFILCKVTTSEMFSFTKASLMMVWCVTHVVLRPWGPHCCLFWLMSRKTSSVPVCVCSAHPPLRRKKDRGKEMSQMSHFRVSNEQKVPFSLEAVWYLNWDKVTAVYSLLVLNILEKYFIVKHTTVQWFI